MTAPSSTPAIARLLGLRPGEGRRTALASAFHFGFVAAVVLVKSASNALVVARYDARALPALYVATALATGVTAALASNVGVGPARHLPRASLLGAAALLTALALAVWSGVPAAVTVLYLFGEVFATLTSIRFWGAASEIFDPREGRRIFGILGGAGMAGAIVSGLAAQLLGQPLGALGLLPLGVVCIVACIGASAALGTPPRAAPAPARHVREDDREREAAARRRARAYLQGDSYPRALGALMLLLAALTAVADYLFRVRAGAELSEAELASLFGALNLWMGVLAVVFQLGVAGRILERWGVFRYLLITPLASVAAAGGCLFVGGIGPAFAVRLIEMAGSLAVNPAAFQLLYGPVPDAVRTRTRAAIDGLVKKAGFAAGGVVLLVLGSLATAEVLVGTLVAVVGAFALVLARTRTLYVRAIEARLTHAGPGSALALGGAEARAVLQEALGAREARPVLTALALLSEDERVDVGPRLPPLLRHPEERVRLAAVRLVAERRLAAVAGELERILREDVRRPRDEAALALARVAPDRARTVLAPLLDSPDAGLSAAAIAALLPLEGDGGAAGAALAHRLESGAEAPPAVRRETARLLGRLRSNRHRAALERLLDDPDPSVRRLACDAAAAIAELELAPRLLGLLGDRAVRGHARAALAALGDAAVPLLASVLDDPVVAMAVRLEAPRVLRAIGTEAAARVLLFSKIQEDPYLRYRIATALSRIHEERPVITVEPRRLREATIRRIDAYQFYLPLYRDLELALPTGSILIRLLGDRLDQNLEMVFRLLHLATGGHAVLPAWRRFAGGDARERAYAMELLEHLLDEDLRRRVIPLLERYHRLPEAWAGVPGQPERAPARILELMVSRDAVLRAVAIHTARRLAPQAAAFPVPQTEEEHVTESVIEKVFFLEGVEIFGQCDVDDLAALAAIAKDREYHGGDVVFEEGDAGDSLFVIVEGRVRFEKGGVEVVTLARRDAFGETSLLDGGPRPVRAVAGAQEVRVLAIDRQDFLELVSDRPELLKGIFAALARHLRLVIDAAATARLSAPGREGAEPVPTP